ncbi:Rhodanese-related sulfurtransferase [gamma proteobacterium BDW918]|jgi:rhodanese-related sulfurtransferase|uniref:Sulfurtransferase n=1 Tax=Zhongshania aliphaticivorans TaxID=1470434 RepID=A0A127M1F4_9GAMM|nr:rhodanese-like domain-containing protein [Zhongshania aliphaticivorans]AMO67068.1 sulfurtransferase [Zhongshania aliphaticivorans]EIF42598.1 Rhodanese-related sulfurtransferase [gamma proteobacterium BDW918]|tara:strand:+ start:9094 stop:9507 length:414 start_codon:yes stop_codon:yes gene_type:complete
MDKLIPFVAEQWVLISALISCLLLLSFHEQRRAGKALTPQQVVNLVNQQGAVVIDLRDKGEFSKGHILDSVSLPFSKLEKEIADHAEKDKPLVLVCKMGQHSSAAGKKLGSLGYTQVNRLKGGISEWQIMQLPLVKK